MKRQWDATELIENFTLLAEEMALLENKSEENRLGFAVLLKFFQISARFPRNKQEVPKVVVSYIARLLGLSPRQYSQYEWEGRTSSRHRTEIREFLGFREFTIQDGEDLTVWLCDKVLTYERQLSYLESSSYERLRELKLEPPTPERLERLIRSAVSATDQKFCAGIFGQISLFSTQQMDALLNTKDGFDDDESHFRQSVFNFLKGDPGRTSLQSIFKEISKLQCIRDLHLPDNLFTTVPPKVLNHYRRRASVETPRELRRHKASIRYTLVAAFCWQRSQEITDSLVELLVQIIHRINARAERRVDKELLAEFKRVDNKSRLLYEIANASLERPSGLVQDVIFPVAGEKTLQAVVKEYKSSSPNYTERVYAVMRSSYLHHYRRMVPQLLETLEFCSNNDVHRPVIKALELLKRYRDSNQRYYALGEDLIIDGVIRNDLKELIIEVDSDGHERINRVNYEICVLVALRDKLRSQEIWVKGAKRYCNPEEDLPQDFEAQRENYYKAIGKPIEAETFIAQLQTEMTNALTMLDQGMPDNSKVKILKKNNGWICLTPLDAQAEPPQLAQLKHHYRKALAYDQLTRYSQRNRFANLFYQSI